MLFFPMVASVQEAFWKTEKKTLEINQDFDVPNTANIMALDEMCKTSYYSCIGKVQVIGPQTTYYIIGIPTDGSPKLRYKYFQAKSCNKPYQNTINKRIRESSTTRTFKILPLQPNENKFELTTCAMMIFTSNGLNSAAAEEFWNKKLGLHVATTQNKKAKHTHNTICVPTQVIHNHMLQSGGFTEPQLKNKTLRCGSAGDTRIEQLSKKLYLDNFNARTLYSISQYEQSKQKGSFANVVTVQHIVQAVDQLRTDLLASNICDPDVIIGSVVSALYEDISWSAAPHLAVSAQFQRINFDIDQVFCVIITLLKYLANVFLFYISFIDDFKAVSVVRSVIWKDYCSHLNDHDFLKSMEVKLLEQEVIQREFLYLK